MKSTPPSLLSSKNERNSSIELFRIIATFSVLVVHFNGWFVGGLPERLNFQVFDWHYCQFFISAATCVCVNLFIIISGFFSLKFKISSFVHIGILLAGIILPLYLIGSIFSGSFSLEGLLKHSLILTQAGYFVQCYLMLVFFSPLLNSFVKNNSRENVLIWTFILFCVEVWFGCIQDTEALAFMKGYSVIHFILVYMLARCVYLYKNELIRVRKRLWIFGYIVCTLILWLMYALGVRWGYANPINVMSSFCLFIPFLYYTYSNRKINYIAKSTFAVYIIQVVYPVFGVLCTIDKTLLTSLPYGLYLLMSFVVITVFFMVCIFYDKLLCVITKPLENYIKHLVGVERYNQALMGS